MDSSNCTQPVDDAMPMEEHQCQRNFSGVKTCPLLVKLARSLNLKHEISAVHVLHHKE